MIASIAAFAVVRVLSRHRELGDLRVYRAEGMAIRHSADLYAHLDGVHNLATYPPFAGVVFTVLTPVPIVALEIACMIVNFALLMAVCHFGCRLAGLAPRDTVVPGLLFAAIAVWSEPVFTTFAYGQINLFLLSLVLWDFTRPAGSRLRGVGVGVAAGLKVTPGILIVYLLLTRRFAAAARAAATFAATIVVSVLVDPHDTRLYWTRYLTDLKRVGPVQDAVNQTLRGMIIRSTHSLAVPAAGTAVIGLTLVAGLVIAWRAWGTLGDAWGLPAAAVTGLLVSPISWTHHWVWALPIAIVLWFQARRWLIPTAVIFLSWLVWVVPHVHGSQLHLDAWQIALSGLYVYFGLGFLALTAFRTRAARAG